MKSVLNIRSVDLILPRCYLSQLDAQNDVLVLENLAFSGYRTYNEEHLNDLDHCRVVLRRMAHFHAISTLMQVGNYKIYGDDICNFHFLNPV